MYNIARIIAIIEKYNHKRLKGEYPNLPHMNDIDFSLLKQEVFHLIQNIKLLLFPIVQKKNKY